MSKGRPEVPPPLSQAGTADSSEPPTPRTTTYQGDCRAKPRCRPQVLSRWQSGETSMPASSSVRPLRPQSFTSHCLTEAWPSSAANGTLTEPNVKNAIGKFSVGRKPAKLKSDPSHCYPQRYDQGSYQSSYCCCHGRRFRAGDTNSSNS